MIWLNSAVGLLTGIVSGMGIGGGSLLILYLTGVAGFDQHAAGGTNLLYFVCLAPPALVSHVRHRMVDVKTALWCALAGTVTTVCASYAAAAVSATLLRRLFGGVMLYVGIKELCARKQG